MDTFAMNASDSTTRPPAGRRPPNQGRSAEEPSSRAGSRSSASGRDAGARRASIREVAERAGVALSSVSRVLSGHPDVSAVMRNRVLDAVAALGYEPNLLAQSLRRGETRTVGFVVGDISNPLLARIALGAETGLRAAGYSMLLTNSMNRPELDVAHANLLHQRRVDGLLLSLADETAAPTLEALDRTGVPMVMVDRDVPRTERTSFVQSAHDEGVTAAAEHLIGLGHRSIALVNGYPNVRPSRERAKVLRRVCRRRGVRAIVRGGAFTAEHGAMVTAELLALADPPTAIIAGGNQILVGVLAALREHHVRIPAQLSLVTCDDVPLAALLDPPVATISRDLGEMGQVAAELLLELLDGQPPRRVVQPVTFRPTASCAPPPG